VCVYENGRHTHTNVGATKVSPSEVLTFCLKTPTFHSFLPSVHTSTIENADKTQTFEDIFKSVILKTHGFSAVG